MHPEAMAYVAKTLDAARFSPVGKTIVELGSYDVNGSVRPLFAGAALYIGVDIRGGQGVDVLADATTWGHTGCCDVVVSTETLEHARDQQGLIRNARRLLRPGGIFILTAAGDGRLPHNCDGNTLGLGEHYANVSASDLAAWLQVEFGEGRYHIIENPAARDIYATAWAEAAE